MTSRETSPGGGDTIDARERFFMDAEFRAACVATKQQAERDGGYLDPETVAKVLMAFDRSGVGVLCRHREPF